MVKLIVHFVLFVIIPIVHGGYPVNGSCPTACNDIKVDVTLEKVSLNRLRNCLKC